MAKNEEIITEKEWYIRMLQKKVYEVLNIEWENGKTTVVDRYTGEIFEVTQAKVGDRLMLRVKKLE
jgi:hypothetical protein